MHMNTKFSYMYRDGSNYKEGSHVIFKGTLTPANIIKLKKHGDEEEYFIPSQVGLENLQHRMTGFPSDDDHVWHEIIGVDSTKDSPTDERTAAVFLRQFLKAKWDVVKASKELGLKI
jgi:hypothetical protein